MQLTFHIIDEPIVHPTNRVWPGAPQYPMPSLIKAYEDGKVNGLKWPKDKKGWQHVPGGPMVHGMSNSRGSYQYGDPFAALCIHSERVYKEWMRGWYDGFEEQCTATYHPDWYRGRPRW